VSDAIERDFQTMVWLAHVAGQLLPAARSLRLDDTLKQFAAPLHEQVDLSREASNLQRFNKNFKHARAVSFPLPLYPLVSPDVLVESFEAGRHISHYIAAAEGSHPYRSRLAELGSGTMLQMMLVDNLIHSDLHPGNILVRLEPPGGLLGLAYRTLSSLANPDGPAMRALARTLDRLQAQDGAAEQSNSSSSNSRGSSRSATADAGEENLALTVSVGGPKTSRWYDLQQQWSNVRAAAADPAGLLSKVQGALNQITAAWLQPHIVLLDVGMATELTGDDQTNMVGLFRAFAGLNGADVAQWVLRFSGSEQACPNPQDFIEDMQVTFEALKKTIAAHQAAEARWKQHQQQQQQQQTSSSSSSNSLSDSVTGLIDMPEQFDSGAEALATVLELVRVHGVSLPGHICAVVVTTLILEGWSNKLAPEHSVLAQVQGMFSPAMYSWHDRMDSVVDIVMDRGDTALLMA
jgi:predicted unusual protein kinase regulating ubiquinone biosynthesis (AarF/ABC1/UbiB family)